MWGTAENGALAESALASAFESLTGRPSADAEVTAIAAIVYAESLGDVHGEIQELLGDRESAGDPDLAIAFRSLAETLADNFLFVVEMPADSVGQRTLVKVSYDDSREFTPTRSGLLSAREVITIDGQGWSEAASWHLEMHAPDGLVIERLWFESWESESLEIVDYQEDFLCSSTAHVTSTHLRRDRQTSARAILRPSNRGLLNQVTIAASIAFVLLWFARVSSTKLSELILASGQGSALAALAFSLPAFFLALLARGGEHELVSRVLVAPRIASLLSAAALWSAGVCFVWRLESQALADRLSVLAVVQLAILGWLVTMRVVGGRR